MKNNKTSDLIEALKEYNKTLAEQIKRMKSFIEDIDKQLIQHRKVEKTVNAKQVNQCFSRKYLIDRTNKYSN
ncbi:putative heme iron utilization protein [Catalinimonas alkaloidigena]|uniref:hypothetical protein n=1 Tax=Catalinimonas alkaloidigena TaxID=1075417 RepID=UPI00240750EB|nr:hypothetical protein [Catalinimonas alkaloidigena]MDF9797546.1 putative heme iron utilization protein [Catalinimonas alkaloidigena]